MAYIRKYDKKVIIEIYSRSNEPKIHTTLAGLSVKYTTESFFNGFWGTRFVIDKPKGRGSTKIIDKLFEI